MRADNAAAIACYPDNERDLEPLIRAALKSEGLSIEHDTLQMLISRLGSDRGVTRSELEKLSLYAMGDKVVTEAHIDAVMGDEIHQLRIEEAADSAGMRAIMCAWTARSPGFGPPALRPAQYCAALWRIFSRCWRSMKKSSVERMQPAQ